MEHSKRQTVDHASEDMPVGVGAGAARILQRLAGDRCSDELTAAEGRIE